MAAAAPISDPTNARAARHPQAKPVAKRRLPTLLPLASAVEMAAVGGETAIAAATAGPVRAKGHLRPRRQAPTARPRRASAATGGPIVDRTSVARIAAKIGAKDVGPIGARVMTAVVTVAAGLTEAKAGATTAVLSATTASTP